MLLPRPSRSPRGRTDLRSRRGSPAGARETVENAETGAVVVGLGISSAVPDEVDIA